MTNVPAYVGPLDYECPMKIPLAAAKLGLLSCQSSLHELRSRQLTEFDHCETALAILVKDLVDDPSGGTRDQSSELGATRSW